MTSPIDVCRASLGPPPRELSPADLSRLRIKAQTPLVWVTPLRWIYLRQGTVWRHGEVVWGHIVQANHELYHGGSIDRPANVLFSFDPYFDTALDELGQIAAGLFDLKETRPRDRKLRRIADHLTSEVPGAWNLPVPTRVTGGHEAFLTTIMVIRNHLPQQYLAASCFPLVACRRGTAVALILPHRYWPPELLEVWEESRS